MTRESQNCWQKPLVPGQADAVEIHSPLKAGADPGGTRGEGRRTGRPGLRGGVRLGGRSGSTGQPSNRPAERRRTVRGPCISYMEGPRFILIHRARSRQHRRVAPPEARASRRATCPLARCLAPPLGTPPGPSRPPPPERPPPPRPPPSSAQPCPPPP